MSVSPYVIENKHIGVKRTRHGLMAFNRNDALIGKSLDEYGEWCQFEVEIFRRFIAHGSTAIDVGANIGAHTLALANLVGSDGTVIAYEPQPRHAQMLACNMALNGIEHVDIHQAAASQRPGSILMSRLPPSDRYFNFGAMSAAGPGPEMCRAEMIDSLDLPNCAFIKIDVEGAEHWVIRGAVDTIKRFQPMLYVEANELENKDIADALDAIGYEGWWSIGPYYDPRNFYTNPVNLWPGTIVANLLCAPKGAVFDMAKFEGPQDNWKKAAARRTPEPSR